MKEKMTGGRIRRFREQKAWTQEHLAGAAQISMRTVQRAEEGAMSAETLSAIAGALNVDVEGLSAPSKEPAHYPRITPALYYVDTNAAVEWLTKAFGFETHMAVPGPDGKFVHVEMNYEGGRIMMGLEVAASNWRAPKSINGATTMSLFIFVEDVDIHYAHACKAGAKIVVEPQDIHGMRRYLAEDPEGHLWWFAMHID